MPISSEQARKNALLGGGRPKGSLTLEQKAKMRSMLDLRKHGYRRAKKIFDAQAVVALGTHKMLEIITDPLTHLKSFHKVNDEKRIDHFLDEGEYGQDYIIVVGTMPDAKAGNMILDRLYGKAKETLDLNVDVKFSLKDLEERRRLEMIDMSSDVEIIDPRNENNLVEENIKDAVLDMSEENVSVEA